MSTGPKRDPLLDPPGVVEVAEVGWEHFGCDAVLGGERVGRRLQPCLVSRHEDEIVALCCQGVGECAPDPRRRTGDECGRHRASIARRPGTLIA